MLTGSNEDAANRGAARFGKTLVFDWGQAVAGAPSQNYTARFQSNPEWALSGLTVTNRLDGTKVTALTRPGQTVDHGTKWSNGQLVVDRNQYVVEQSATSAVFANLITTSTGAVGEPVNAAFAPAAPRMTTPTKQPGTLRRPGPFRFRWPAVAAQGVGRTGPSSQASTPSATRVMAAPGRRIGAVAAGAVSVRL